MGDHRRARGLRLRHTKIILECFVIARADELDHLGDGVGHVEAFVLEEFKKAGLDIGVLHHAMGADERSFARGVLVHIAKRVRAQGGGGKGVLSERRAVG